MYRRSARLCTIVKVGSMLKQTSRIDELLDDTLQMIQLHLASIRNTFLKSELGKPQSRYVNFEEHQVYAA